MNTEIDQLAAIDAAGARISELARSADQTTPLRRLGRWKLHDLVHHLGNIHRWAGAIVTARSMDVPRGGAPKLGGTELCDWFDKGLTELDATLRSCDPSDPCPNFNPGSDKTVGWWARRQMHETTVHRWDVESALAVTTPIDQAVAADGVDEFLDVFVRTRGKQTLTAPLVLATVEPANAWTLTLADKPGRLDVSAGRTGEAETELAGASEAMLLLLWGRLGLEESGLTVSGDRSVAVSMAGNP
jgi:uncharacterized protein (TIGR03083 family)